MKHDFLLERNMQLERVLEEEEKRKRRKQLGHEKI